VPALHRPIIVRAVTRTAVFGAGAMGTAVAMHAARVGHDVTLWGSVHDAPALGHLAAHGKHPSLPEHVPASIKVHGPDELDAAADGAQFVVLGANSHGARSLASLIRDHVEGALVAISVAKGMEPGTGKRMSEVYGEELRGVPIVSVGGPCLATELASGLPTASVWAGSPLELATQAGTPFDSPSYQLAYTDDVIGVELCSMMKNVAAIGLGMLDGLGKPTGEDFKNAKAALFTKAAHEIVELVGACGGRAETAFGLAGVGDQLVTSLGGRNRLYGELVGAGESPDATLRDLELRGLTVEGVDSTRDVARLADEHELDLPYHAAIRRVLSEGADPRDILEVLR
jgi:glycerol-3-phosphate dehydrogenase (NAD(P)+)